MMAQEFDANLWSQLPTEILEEYVLRRLPFSTLCRFRVVCKCWNTILAVRPAEPYLLDIPCSSSHEDQLRHCYLYSPVTNIRSHIDLSYVIASMSQLDYPSSWKRQIETYCSDGGLLCVWGKVLEPRAGRASIPRYSLLVCNPLTRSCKALPKLPQAWDPDLYKPMDLLMHKESSWEYRIFAATSVSVLTYFIHDSVSRSWKYVLNIKPIRPYNEVLYCSIIFEGVFYTCLGDLRNSLEEQFTLFTYDIKDQRKSRLGIIGLSFVVSDGHLPLIVEEDSCFSINKVDLSDSTNIRADLLACVSRPKPSNWIYGATFEYKNSTIIVSDDDRNHRVGVHLFSWSGDVEELQPITPVVNRPRLGYHWRYYRKNMKMVNFDNEAIIQHLEFRPIYHVMYIFKII